VVIVDSLPLLLSTGEVARLAGASRQHVVDLCTRGELPFVWVGRHRRVPRSAVDRLLGRAPLSRDQERSLWLHRAVLASLAAEPDRVLAKASSNLARLRAQHPTGMTARWLDEWQRVLDAGIDEVAETLASRAPLALELRQNSPFAGVLTPELRTRVLSAFAEHWRTDHGAPARADHS
jgi:excisionase family DNA binding protein